MSPEHPSILTWTADKECPPPPTRTTTLYPEPVAAESSPAADFPKQVEYIDWLLALPEAQRPTSGDEAVRLYRHWLLARRAGCERVERVGGAR